MKDKNVEDKSNKILSMKLAIVEEDMIKKDELNKQLKQIEKENKDNEALKQYIKTLKKINKLEDQTKEDKDSLYNEMLTKNIDYLEGALYNVTLKRPYLRMGVDMKRFTEMFSKDSKTYKQLIKETLCKGSINIKEQ